MLEGDGRLPWVWHPGSGRQTIVFATPVRSGRLFLWSSHGQESTGNPGHSAEMIKELPDGASQP
ncbi:hypothetical protein [Streptosporangium sp. NPDC000396]|uniref:hypothetical protein n=1 Tax=Streptosporangium sp. NPDC000396 TaxID=3366185 RepID=UPI0036D1692B